MMTLEHLWLLAALIFVAATIYSSVGHAGASGYIAVMALLGVAPAVMKPTALLLNILVASLGTIRLWRVGLVNVRVLTPLALASVPMAFIGGAIQLPGHWYKILVGLVLAFAAVRLLLDRGSPSDTDSEAGAVKVPLAAALASGGSVGLLSGLTGTGGGIFLSPMLIFFRWTSMRGSAGITAPFILVNSIAGLAGNFAAVRSLPPELPYLAGAALAGGVLGTQFAIRWFDPKALQRMLAVVLAIASAKFLIIT